MSELKAALGVASGRHDLRDVLVSDYVSEDVELLKRGKRFNSNPADQKTKESYAVAPIRPGDTLVTLALRYGCKVAHLKKLNRLFQDQDVFGLRTIRVPVHRYGVVEELVRTETEANQFEIDETVSFDIEQLDPSVEDDDDVGDDDDHTTDERNSLLSGHFTIRESLSKQGRQAVEYLESVDKDVNAVVSGFAALQASSTAINASVTCRRHRHNSSTFWGFDCGIQWSTTIVILFIVAVVIPIVILICIYFFDKSHQLFNP